MLQLSDKFIKLKNALSNGYPIFMLVEIQDFPTVGNYYRYVNNLDDINWNGTTYNKMSFEIGTVNVESNAAYPEINLNILAYGQFRKDLVNPAYSMKNKTVNIKYVSYKEVVDETYGIIFEKDYVVKNVDIDEEKATINFVNASYNQAFPSRKCLKSFCDFEFGGVECSYVGKGVKAWSNGALDSVNVDSLGEDENFFYFSSAKCLLSALISYSQINLPVNAYDTGINYYARVLCARTAFSADTNTYTLQVRNGTTVLGSATFSPSDADIKDVIIPFTVGGSGTAALNIYITKTGTYEEGLKVGLIRVYDSSLKCSKTFKECRDTYFNNAKFGGFMGMLDDYANV